MAIVAIAVLVVSCSRKISMTNADLKDAPVQRVDDMFAVQTKNGVVLMRMEALTMEHYENDTLSWDYFPSGLSVYAYKEDGRMESLIISDKAKHTVGKGKRRREELWSAFGNVVVHNVINRQTMETDTIYWDREKAEIYTDCYVKMYSPDGFMQGYGMRSDDRARNSILLNPFNSYGLAVQDTTKVPVDTINFIGPIIKN